MFRLFDYHTTIGNYLFIHNRFNGGFYYQDNVRLDFATLGLK
jgi:hypothetical protein